MLFEGISCSGRHKTIARDLPRLGVLLELLLLMQLMFLETLACKGTT